MTGYYTLAHGAKYNVGDFLIKQRAIDLLRRYKNIESNDLRFEDIAYKELSEENLEEIDGTDALIIAGGPSIQPDFKDIYPSLDQILDLNIPVVPLGVGWRGTSESSFNFDSTSRELLTRMFSRIELGGVRDLPTKRLLEDIGIDNVVLAGCPAWHDLNRNNESFTAPDSIQSLVVTSPQKGDFNYGPQWVYLLYRLAREFPEADRYCSFHHGLEYVPDYKPLHVTGYNYSIAGIAKALGYEIYDPSRQPKKLEKYRDIDVHIGYRVHAHIHFIANGQPSFLLCQDGRGTGASESLRTTEADVQAYGRSSFRTPVNEVIDNVKQNLVDEFTAFRETDDAITYAHNNMKAVINGIS